jgi:hypothetical protein
MENREVLFRSLNMWKNYIQTEDVATSSQDAINMGCPEKCKMLSPEQQEFVVRLEELACDILNGKRKL